MPNGPAVEVSNFDELEGIVIQVAQLAPVTMLPARRTVRVGLVAAAAGDYAAGDVVSNSVTDTNGVPNVLSGAVSTPGDVAILDAVLAKCTEDSVLWRLRLHFYDYQPLPADVEMDDNIAADWAKVAAGRDGYLGYVDLPAMADRGTAMAQAQAVNLRQMFATRATSTGLWFVVESLDIEANETAGMRLDFCFSFLN